MSKLYYLDNGRVQGLLYTIGAMLESGMELKLSHNVHKNEISVVVWGKHGASRECRYDADVYHISQALSETLRRIISEGHRCTKCKHLDGKRFCGNEDWCFDNKLFESKED